MRYQLEAQGDVSIQVYFNSLKESNLSHFDECLEDIWLTNLKTHRQEHLHEEEHPADYPTKYIDDHFVGFNAMRFILFLTYLVLSKFDWNSLTLEKLENLWKNSLRFPLVTLSVWRIYWNRRNEYSDFFSDLSSSNKYMLDFYFMSNLSQLLKGADSMFPLQVSTLLNEHTMKFLRVSFRLIKLAKTNRYFDFVNFFRLYESSEDLELFYERVAQNSSHDRKIVQYVSLKYESVLNCKRKIEEAEDGDFIAVKVYLQTKLEVLSSLEDDQDFVRDKISFISNKIEDAKLELHGLNFSSDSFHGMTARKVASKLLEKSKQTKELNEYVTRKTQLLRNFNMRLQENKEKIYIAMQYDK